MSSFENPNPPVPPQPAPPVPPQMPPSVPDYMIWAILETVLCCLPCGIMGLVYANKANTQAAMGNLAEALQAAKSAKTWLIVGIVGWALVIFLYLAFIALAIGLAVANGDL
ncbi:MAG: CD225/dispanin family protein [Planctomycetia bacterium]|nr:CD225/dispanin family protein [Planctomycetia bacterium]